MLSKWLKHLALIMKKSIRVHCLCSAGFAMVTRLSMYWCLLQIAAVILARGAELNPALPAWKRLLRQEWCTKSEGMHKSDGLWDSAQLMGFMPQPNCELIGLGIAGFPTFLRQILNICSWDEFWNRSVFFQLLSLKQEWRVGSINVVPLFFPSMHLDASEGMWRVNAPRTWLNVWMWMTVMEQMGYVPSSTGLNHYWCFKRAVVHYMVVNMQDD